MVDRARAALAELKISAARYTVRAPAAGVIEALPYKSGERPPPHASVVILLSGRTFARVYVPEPRRAQFVPGRKVLVAFDGGEAPQQGQVRFIATEAAFTPYYAFTQADRSRLSYLTEIDLTPVASAFELMAGKLLPYVFIGLLQVTIVLLAVSWLFDVPVQGGLLEPWRS